MRISEKFRELSSDHSDHMAAMTYVISECSMHLNALLMGGLDAHFMLHHPQDWRPVIEAYDRLLQKKTDLERFDAGGTTLGLSRDQLVMDFVDFRVCLNTALMRFFERDNGAFLLEALDVIARSDGQFRRGKVNPSIDLCEMGALVPSVR